MHTAFSGSVTANTIGSTRGFFSFSTQSCFDNSKGPTFFERLKSNTLHLSSNIHRFTEFNNVYHNFTMIFRLVQHFCIYLIPQCRVFWNMNSTTSFFTYLLEIPLHICVVSDVDYHCYFLILLFLFFLISLIFILVLILKDPSEYSISNNKIFYISFFCSVLTPIFSILVFSLFGFCLHEAVFHKNTEQIVIASLVFGSLAVILAIISHYFSYYIMKGTSKINFSALFVPWSPYIRFFANFEMYYNILAFLGEFLSVEEKYYQIGFSIVSLIAANPATIVFMFMHPVFQDLNDNIYWATMATVNMISTILMDFRFLTDNLTPVVLFVVVIISFVVFLLLYIFIMRNIMSNYSKKMFSVYRHLKPSLPPPTPLIFTTPMQNQSLLSHEAYSVMQSFSSLEITTAREYHYFMYVGTYMKLPAVKNIDFIKWGLNYFHDSKTLIICAQICQYFKDNSQTQAVLIQRLNDTEDISIFVEPVIYNLVLYHADAISDKPAFLKKLQKKAVGGLVRSRRALSIFWGSVLKHSTNAMYDSLCRLRDTISETQTHFDELTRCYPVSMDAIGLYLTFMTEICGEFIKCNKYINQLSARVIEMKGDEMENDETIKGISNLLNDPSRNFSPYLSKLTQFLDQESRTSKSSNGIIIAIWFLGVISSLTLIVCILVIMIHTLVSFNEYPKILSIVNSADDIFIEMSSLIIGIRRICLFASGDLDNYILIEMIDDNASVYEDPDLLLPWLIERGEFLPELIMRFYKNMTNNIEMLNIVTRQTRPFNIFGVPTNGSLDFIIDMMSMAVRNIAVNIPSYFSYLNCLGSSKTRNSILNLKDQISKIHCPYCQNKKKMIKDDSSNLEEISNYSGICNSSELRLLIENIESTAQICDDFIQRFQQIAERNVNSLSKLLFYSMILFPICYVVIFGLVLCLLSFYLRKESNFRLTLFLSLPETVASEIYNSGGISYSSSQKIFLGSDNKEEKKDDIEIMTPEKMSQKEKALRIESLYQFQSRSNLITGSGLKEYIISCSFFIVIAAFSMFFLTYYSRSVNETFLSRSFMLCASALRYSSTSYAMMFIEEGFISPCLSIFNISEILRLSEKFLERATNFHRSLTYGDDNIKFDFHGYKSIENLMLNKIEREIPEFLRIEHSHALLQHDGYKSNTVDTFMRLFLESSYGIIENIKNDKDHYGLNGSTWQNFNHLIVSHLRDDLEMATYYYITGVSEVIDKSFMIALIFSIFLTLALLLILIFPITYSSLAISRYFSTMLHILCQIPPETFNRSFYINQWLKGRISKSNYRQYETAFKRTVSSTLQNKIFEESDEKVIVFGSNGELINSPYYDLSNLNELNLQNVLTFVVNPLNPSVIDDCQHAFVKFQESKDKCANIAIVAQSTNNKVIKMTFTGISSEDLSSSISTNQHYYSHIVVILKDVTKEATIESQYEKEKEKTFELYKQLIPLQIAVKIHDGEHNISFASTIGSVLSVSIVNYNECLEKISIDMTSEILIGIRTVILNSLSEFSNISMISISGDDLLFAAGLFNEEQNGRTETFDTLQFASRLYRLISDIFDTNNLSMSLKFGVATGGPIFYKLICDDEMSAIVSGETVVLAKMIKDLCEPGNLLFERTTFECSNGLNINPQQAGQLEYQGKQNLYYSIMLDKNSEITPNIN